MALAKHVQCSFTSFRTPSSWLPMYSTLNNVPYFTCRWVWVCVAFICYYWTSLAVATKNTYAVVLNVFVCFFFLVCFCFCFYMVMLGFRVPFGLCLQCAMHTNFCIHHYLFILHIVFLYFKLFVCCYCCFSYLFCSLFHHKTVINLFSCNNRKTN